MGGDWSTPAAPGGYSDPCSPLRMQRRSFLLLALLALLALTSAVAKKKGETAGAGDWKGAGAQVRPDPRKGES